MNDGKDYVRQPLMSNPWCTVFPMRKNIDSRDFHVFKNVIPGSNMPTRIAVEKQPITIGQDYRENDDADDSFD